METQVEKPKAQAYSNIVTYENSYELLKKLLALYSVSINLEKTKNYLRPKLIEILTYYVLKGYSTETKDFIMDSIPRMTRKNLNQINSELTKKGYLLRHKHQSHHREIPKSLQDLKNYSDDTFSKKPIFVVIFSKNNG